MTVMRMAKEDTNDGKSAKFDMSKAALRVVKMLDGIPKDLVDLFTPNTDDELDQLEINVVRWWPRSQEREKVMRLQKRYDLPLKPNQSLRDVTIRIRILDLKKNRKFKDKDNDGGKYPPSKDEDGI